MGIILGCLFDLLYNHGMLNVEAILMSTHNTHFHDNIVKFPEISLNICFLELSAGFLRGSKTAIGVRVIAAILYMFLLQ